jgi:hypothetical protein
MNDGVIEPPINYLFNQQIMDAEGRAYRITGRLEDPANTLLVSSIGGNGGALQFCIAHSVAYGIHDTCTSCRDQVVLKGLEAGVTSCDTP